MLGAKLGKLFGARLVFQIRRSLHGLAMGMMALQRRSDDMMLDAQAMAGLAAAALVPALVVLIAANYHGRPAIAGAGFAGRRAGHGRRARVSASPARWARRSAGAIRFALLFVVSVVVLVLSFRLKPVPRQP